MSMESAAVIGGVAVVNKLSSSSLASAQQSAISKLGKPGGQAGMKKTLDIFSEEDQSILSTITHGALHLHQTHLKTYTPPCPTSTWKRVIIPCCFKPQRSKFCPRPCLHARCACCQDSNDRCGHRRHSSHDGAVCCFCEHRRRVRQHVCPLDQVQKVILSSIAPQLPNVIACKHG
jgi:hypothetical protein